MINKFSKTLILTAACTVSLFALNQANAHDHFGFNIQIGSPPPQPPPVVERQWAPPSNGAIWVEPHYEWSHGQWIWIHGYYMYPPGPDFVWVAPRYTYYHHQHTWVGGHWDHR